MFTQGLKGAFPKNEDTQTLFPFMISLRSHTMSLSFPPTFEDSYKPHPGSSEVREEQTSPSNEDMVRSPRAYTTKNITMAIA